MTHFSKDFGRLINGVSLVAREIARRSDTLSSAGDGGVQSLLKKTLQAATDTVGLTRGKIRELPVPKKAAESSVVYFDNVHQTNVEGVQTAEQPASKEADGDVPVRMVVEEIKQETEASVSSERSVSSSTMSDSLPSASGAEELGRCGTQVTTASNGVEANKAATIPLPRRKPRERKVPSTSFTRGLGFASLGAGLAWGTVQESAKRLMYGRPASEDKQSAISPFLSERNAERLALGLCRMRGAALKLGQMMSIQDESLVPAPILAALEIVRQGADVMPRKQLDRVLTAELGPDWVTKLSSFDYEPLAAASIGQVHKAVSREGLHLAMKIQYPGVADSIESDIQNVKLLLDYTNLIPEGLYIDRAMKVAKEELSRECDYILEASNQRRFRKLLSDVDGFYVPLVLGELSSKCILTTELVPGIPIDKVALLDQETRNNVGKKLLELTLMELFVFRFMQTDPNWSNFLYDEATKQINLIDFGAARDYPKAFVDDYLRMVLACANRDRDTVIEMSQRLGFLTGMESEIMLDAHMKAAFVVGLPFSKLGGHDFGAVNITQNISNLGATMLKHRLTPPPDEAYSLHRKLSGAFLACMKLGSVVPCRDMLLQVYECYTFGEDGAGMLSSGETR